MQIPILVTTVKFLRYMVNILKVVIGQETYLRGKKGFLKRSQTRNRIFVNFGQFPCSWIRIRIPTTDPYPGQPNECGSLRIRIHNIEKRDLKIAHLKVCCIWYGSVQEALKNVEYGFG
jgi:hypothetical protein